MESLSKGDLFRLGSEQYLHPLSTVKEGFKLSRVCPCARLGSGVKG